MQTAIPPRSPPDVPAGLLRRLGAVFYDAMLLLAVLMIATAAFLPPTGGEALDPDAHPALEFVYRAVLVGDKVPAENKVFDHRFGQRLHSFAGKSGCCQ